MKQFSYALILLAVVCIIGCAGIEPPSPDRILSHPLGTGPIHIGMTKEEVEGIWGEPDLIKSTGESKDAGTTQKEEWIYHGFITNLPINYGHLSKPLHLYFDGNNLTHFTEE